MLANKEGRPASRKGSKLEDPRNRLRFVTKKESVDVTEPGVLYSRQSIDEADPFQGVYDKYRLLEPPFSFTQLYKIYEESDVLQECIDAMITNVDGFGYKLVYLRDDLEKIDSPESKVMRRKLENFFDHANDEQSWLTIRKLMRMDYEVLGNGGFEVIRNLKGEVAVVNYIPFRTVRLSARDTRGTTVTVDVPRDGRLVPLRVKKHFRKFVQHRMSGRQFRFFKEFGDPRILCAVDGEYKKTEKECKEVASEILHFASTVGGGAYGIPRWLGALLAVVGRRSAQYVNYDLFENQGISPMVVTVSGGRLTDASVAELEALISGMRGVENWNRVCLLESAFESTGLDEKGTAKIELKNMHDYRKEDMMFSTYLTDAEKSCRHRFRLPPLYVGSAESFTYATAQASRVAAEEQIFSPERRDFDEKINNMLVRRELKVYDWSYVSQGPKIAGSEELTTGVSSFGSAGALTVNHAITIANEAFGMAMSHFAEDWAKYPLPIVLKLLELGQLKGLDAIRNMPAEPLEDEFANEIAQEGIMKSEVFTDEEKALYKRLKTIQMAIDGKAPSIRRMLDDHRAGADKQ